MAISLFNTINWSDPLATIVGVLCLLLFIRFLRSNLYALRLRHIPTIGTSIPFLSTIDAWKNAHGSLHRTLAEGYKKYPNGLFKLRTLDIDAGGGWYVVANCPIRNPGSGSGEPLWLEEMSRMPDDILSPVEFFGDFLQLDYTLGRGVTTSPYHISVIRTPMTRNIASKYEEMYEEIVEGFDKLLEKNIASHSEGKNGDDSVKEWMSLPIYQSSLQVAARVMTRLSFGTLENSQSEELSSLFKSALLKLSSGRKLHLWPRFLRPLVSRLMIDAQGDIRRMAKILTPGLNARLETSGEAKETHNDALTWMLDEAQRTGEGQNAHDLATRLYFLGLSLDGIAWMVSFALYEFTKPSNSHCLSSIMDEIKDILATEGWTKQAISTMYKLDSFVREVQRVYDMQPIHLGQRALKSFTFSDGTYIPAGTTLCVNSYSVHRDERSYANAREFDGLRFLPPSDSNPKAKDSSGHSEGTQKKQNLMTMPTLDYHVFGYGKHACPGRFTAAYMIKTMLAHILVNYDFEMEPASLSTMNGHSTSMSAGNVNGTTHVREWAIDEERDARNWKPDLSTKIRFQRNKREDMLG